MHGYLVAYKQIKPDPRRLQALLDLPEPTCAKDLKRVCGLFSYYAKWIPNFSKKAVPLQARTQGDAGDASPYQT